MLGTLAIACFIGLGATQSSYFETRRFANGISISARSHSKSDAQWFGLYLPAGFLDEDAGQAGWSTLAQEALLLSEDSFRVPLDMTTTRGAVLPRALMLSREGNAKELALLLESDRRWISVLAIEGDVFEPARKRALEALGDASSIKAQRQLAVCVWNQLARQEVTNLKLRGGLTQAKPEEVVQWLRSRLAQRAPRLATVGPRTAGDARAAAEKVLAKIQLPSVDPAAAPEAAAMSAEARSIEATWDLASPHLLEWYVLPCDEPRDHVEAMVLASCLRDVDDDLTDKVAVGLAVLSKKDQVMSSVLSFALSPEQHVLLFNIHLTKDADFESQRSYPRQLLERLVKPAKGEKKLSERFVEIQAVYTEPLDVKATTVSTEHLSLTIDIKARDAMERLCELELESGLDHAKMFSAAKSLTSARILELAVEGCAPEKASRAEIRGVKAPKRSN